jgi:DNA-binding NtrC family response regulator
MPPSPQRPERRVLVIDDEESLRHALGKALRRAGYVVETAATGHEGVDRFTSGGFDAVVTDVRLPDLSGLDIAALLTEIDPDVPVLVISGYGSVDSALEAMRRGARDFLQKPFETSDLLAALEREMAKSDERRDERRLRAQVERRFAPETFAEVERELHRLPHSPSDPAPGADPAPRSSPPPGASNAPPGEAAMPSAAEGPVRLDEARRRFEVRYVEDLLARTGGNVAAAARLAGISRPNFHKKLRTLGVDPQRFKRAHRRGKSAGL